MLKGFQHARLACGCRLAFREGTPGSPVTVIVDRPAPGCVNPLHVRDLPLYDYRGERDAMLRWSEAKGPEGLETYRREHNARSIDGLGAAMLIALVAVTPMGGWQAAGAFPEPVVLLAAVGVGLSSSVIPYVSDQLAMARLPRATYALMISLLPAFAVLIGVIVLAQIPTSIEVAGVGLVVAGVALHRQSAGPELPPEPVPA